MKDLINDGWTLIMHSPDPNYHLYRKLVRDENRQLKGIWRAKHKESGMVIDITYEQALGYEPIEDTPIKRLSRELGRMLLPQR